MPIYTPDSFEQIDWNGHSIEAYHALWPVFAAYFLWVGISDAAVYVKTGELQLLPPRWWVHAVTLAAVLGYGILRNLP